MGRISLWLSVRLAQSYSPFPYGVDFFFQSFLSSQGIWRMVLSLCDNGAKICSQSVFNQTGSQPDQETKKEFRDKFPIDFQRNRNLHCRNDFLLLVVQCEFNLLPIKANQAKRHRLKIYSGRAPRLIRRIKIKFDDQCFAGYTYSRRRLLIQRSAYLCVANNKSFYAGGVKTLGKLTSETISTMQTWFKFKLN